MAKIVLLLVISCLCLWQIEAQTTCERITRTCETNQIRVGFQDDVTNFLNADCRRTNPAWRDVNRCQMERAACELTSTRCSELSCANIAQALGR